jgi:hypothetical protein
LSHVHLQQGGHFISLLLIFFFCLLSTPLHVHVTSTNLNCLLSTEWYALCTMGREIEGWVVQAATA